MVLNILRRLCQFNIGALGIVMLALMIFNNSGSVISDIFSGNFLVWVFAVAMLAMCIFVYIGLDEELNKGFPKVRLVALVILIIWAMVDLYSFYATELAPLTISTFITWGTMSLRFTSIFIVLWLMSKDRGTP